MATVARLGATALVARKAPEAGMAHVVRIAPMTSLADGVGIDWDDAISRNV